ncbi:MAG: RlmE family RNA methyltransferase [Rhodospirillales bacterium]|nr:RlmE family RNA methyltransferase [Rhodospirillales bacterium]MDE0711202.1 RlmE family RNA methyltransferase [Rhodospirillales bacterium]
MRGRSVSEQRWLRRQQTDPFVAAAAKEGYRSRSAYKLAAIDDRHDFLRRSRRIVDLGSAPGGWLQVAVARAPTARIVALDLQTVAPVGDAIILEGDAFAADAAERLRSALGGPADAVLSDMAPPATGHRSTDQLRSLALAEAAVDCAVALLAPGGTLLVKLIRGQGEEELVRALGDTFAKVRREKPPASRADSSEMFLLASGFRPPPDSAGR